MDTVAELGSRFLTWKDLLVNTLIKASSLHPVVNCNCLLPN